MYQIKTDFDGLFIIKPIRVPDNRGYFEKKYDLSLRELMPMICETYISSSNKNVLRGLHFQRGISSQSKLITCIKGSFLDIAVDLRPKQPTFGKCFIYELKSNATTSLLIPGEFAHGVYALEDDSILLNMASNDYSPSDESGINWNSIPELGFIKTPTVSSKDSLLLPLDDILKKIAYE